MAATLYHREVYFEPNASDRIAEFISRLPVLTYSRHAKLQTVRDRYGLIPVLKVSDLKASDAFEYLLDGTAIDRVVFRIEYFSGRFAYSYSVSRDGVVVTCWANEKSDGHGTLDRSRYAGK